MEPAKTFAIANTAAVSARSLHFFLLIRKEYILVKLCFINESPWLWCNIKHFFIVHQPKCAHETNFKKKVDVTHRGKLRFMQTKHL